MAVDRFLGDVVPMKQMLCTCGERQECPRDCAVFTAFRERANRMLTKLLDGAR